MHVSRRPVGRIIDTNTTVVTERDQETLLSGAGERYVQICRILLYEDATRCAMSLDEVREYPVH